MDEEHDSSWRQINVGDAEREIPLAVRNMTWSSGTITHYSLYATVRRRKHWWSLRKTPTTVVIASGTLSPDRDEETD
jgi:hypothetical protein